MIQNKTIGYSFFFEILFKVYGIIRYFSVLKHLARYKIIFSL